MLNYVASQPGFLEEFQVHLLLAISVSGRPQADATCFEDGQLAGQPSEHFTLTQHLLNEAENEAGGSIAWSF